MQLLRLSCVFMFLAGLVPVYPDTLPGSSQAEIRTPAPGTAPRINGASRFGARPGSPILYTVPATGDLPLRYSVDGLPDGCALDPGTGQITGRLDRPGTYRILLRASNARGEVSKPFQIVIGETIELTPAMGWNSWNCFAGTVDQDKILRAARAMVASGLTRHGWAFINIDDTWQGRRAGPQHALQPNEKFPNMAALCAAIHTMGLKVGIYSTPWVSSYAKFAGGSSDDPEGTWTPVLATRSSYRTARYSFEQADANQWAAWGFDYLKYDWNPNDLVHVASMSAALRLSGRDIIYSLSNAAPFQHAADWARLANSWRTTGDIWEFWATEGEFWKHGVSEIGFNQDRWAPTAGPGHWNDPDMLVVGTVGWGHLHPSQLTPEEQYTHLSLWCLLSAPLLIGCDLEQLDPFTLNLLCNDEVLAIDQDVLGRQAVRVGTSGGIDIYRKELEDGSCALGFFNRENTLRVLDYNKLQEIGFDGPQHVRDLWRQTNLPDVVDLEKNVWRLTIPAHGAQLYKLSPVN